MNSFKAGVKPKYRKPPTKTTNRINKCTQCRGKGTSGGKVPVIQNIINNNEVLNEIQDVLHKQTAKGYAKYGKTVNPYSLETIDWIDHAIEESIDKIVYLTCIKKSIEMERAKNKRGVSE